MEYQKLSANVLFYETPLFLTSVAILQISRFVLHALTGLMGLNYHQNQSIV
jgi:hypothetical protein